MDGCSVLVLFPIPARIATPLGAKEQHRLMPIFAPNPSPSNNYRSSFGQKIFPCPKRKLLISISDFQPFSFSAFCHEH
jgi:hypothetical protein